MIYECKPFKLILNPVSLEKWIQVLWSSKWTGITIGATSDLSKNTSEQFQFKAYKYILILQYYVTSFGIKNVIFLSDESNKDLMDIVKGCF